MSNLSRSELDALNMMRCYDGLHRMDLFVMSISKSIMDDLVDSGHARSGWLCWNITKKGRNALREADITQFSDTRQ